MESIFKKISNLLSLDEMKIIFKYNKSVYEQRNPSDIEIEVIEKTEDYLNALRLIKKFVEEEIENEIINKINE